MQNVCSMDLTVTKLCRAGEINACYFSGIVAILMDC